ncbi:MAG: GAF domain-containing protein [Cyanobacteria bacterium J06627_3]
MVDVDLKKLVLRKEHSLIQDVVNATAPTACIETAMGHLIWGTQSDSYPHRYAITLNEDVLGWVRGNEKAEVIANLISQLAYREFEKRNLAQELLSKYKEISLLFNLSEKIIDSPNIQEVASLVLAEARQLLNSSHGVLLLLHETTNKLEHIASFGEGGPFQTSIALDEDIVGTIVQSGRGEIINAICSDPRHKGGQRAAVICVPLKRKESIVGAIALSRSLNTPYNAEDLKLLTTMAFQAAGVINALLHERQLKESRQNDLIFRLSSQIRESLELETILTTAVSEIYRALTVDRCCFLWIQAKARSDEIPPEGLSSLDIVTESKHSHLPALVGTYAPKTIGGLVHWFSQQSLVQLNDIQTLRDGATRRFLQTHGFAALLAIPIQTRSGKLGAICCGTSKDARAWSDSEVSLLQAVTNQLAIALDQADLYDQSRQAAQLAEDKAQQLATTIDTLQQTQLQLIQSEKMSGIGQMVAGVAHEINNPVTFIHGNLQHVQDYAQDLMTLIELYQADCSTPSVALKKAVDDIELPFVLEDLPKALNSMMVGTERIYDIVLSLKNFSRLDQAEFKSADIHEGIDSTLLILRHRLKPRNHFPGIEIVKNYDQLPAVDCYPGQLNQVFMNLLVNAIDVLETSSLIPSPTITIDTRRTAPNRIQICIADNGPGISANIQSKLFEPFFTTKDVGKGTGLGLSTSNQIITERHGGKLQCQSELGYGATFVIEIPIQQGQENAQPQ